MKRRVPVGTGVQNAEDRSAPGGWGGTAQPPPPHATDRPGPTPRGRSRAQGGPGPLRAHGVVEGRYCRPQ